MLTARQIDESTSHTSIWIIVYSELRQMTHLRATIFLVRQFESSELGNPLVRSFDCTTIKEDET